LPRRISRSTTSPTGFDTSSTDRRIRSSQNITARSPSGPLCIGTEVWVEQQPGSIGVRPPVSERVFVHGDACAPNTLINDNGTWVGHVDFGDLATGDRWADLAIASLSLDWNFGEGHHPEFFDAYGIEPDVERIRYYRDLWDLAS
jgi:kanamycin kinase